MARAIWIETFGPSTPEADMHAYLDHAYGPNGRLLADLSVPEIDFRIARAEGRIVGYSKLGPPWLPDAEPGALQLSQLYVTSDWQGRGIAQELMNWTVAAAGDRGAAALLLTVWEHNPRAIRFYERHGFVHVADYPFQVGSRIDRDLILRRPL
jgi:ribosomal protein S18 acetylase RimI-like enzyme